MAQNFIQVVDLPSRHRAKTEPGSTNKTESKAAGREGDVHLLVTAVVDGPANLRQPSAGGYAFKKLRTLTGWDPTPCWTR